MKLMIDQFARFTASMVAWAAIIFLMAVGVTIVGDVYLEIDAAIARKREVKAQREAKAQKAKSEFCPNCMPMNLPKDMQSAYYSFVVMDGWLYHNDGYRGGKVAKVKYRKIAKINYCPWCGRALK